PSCCLLSFFLYAPATTEIYTLSLHDALPICTALGVRLATASTWRNRTRRPIDDGVDDGGVVDIGEDDVVRWPRDIDRRHDIDRRSEEHTSELQSPCNLVCRLLLEKKKKNTRKNKKITKKKKQKKIQKKTKQYI